MLFSVMLRLLFSTEHHLMNDQHIVTHHYCNIKNIIILITLKYKISNPLLFCRAYIVLPNNFVHKSFGKVLFVVFDLLIGWFLFEILKRKCQRDSTALMYAAVWLFNPFAINVSTRGNAESVIGALVVSTLYLLETKREILAAIMFVTVEECYFFATIHKQFILGLEHRFISKFIQ
jgi:hypothetical protein